MTLRRRLASAAAAAVAIVFALAAAVVYLAVRDQVRGQVDSQLRDRAGVVVPVLNQAGATLRFRGVLDDAATNLRIPQPPSGEPFGYFQVIDRDGNVQRLRSSESVALPVDDSARAVARGDRDEYFTDFTGNGTALRVLVTPLTNGRALELALPLDQVDDLLSWLRWALVLIGIGGVGVAAGLSVAASRPVLAPLAKLNQTAHDITHTSDLARRIPHEADDEVGRLADSFNEMLAALETSQLAQRNLVLDASHELRTPLTAIRTNIDVLRDSDAPSGNDRREILAAIDEQLRELSVLVADVVELARGNEPQGRPAIQRLDQLVERCVERAELLAPDASFALDLQPSTINGVAAQLERAVSNLLDNAIKWSPPGAAIDVRVRDGEVTVRDRGPGINDHDLPHVFDRFYRSERARALPGSGLGLAIVLQAAQAHRGTVAAEHAPGGGALLRLTLPALPDTGATVAAPEPTPTVEGPHHDDPR